MRALWLVVLALVVSACAQHTHPIVSEDSPEWDCETMGNQRCGSDEQGYLRDVGIYSKRVEVEPSWTDAEWLEFGDLICGVLNAGASMDEVLNEIGYAHDDDWSVSFEEAVAVTIYGIVASADNLCTEHAGDIDAFLDTQ